LRNKIIPSFAEELHLNNKGYKLIAGLDEVGRGPLAGPVVAAAVILDPQANNQYYKELRDSKVLTANQRQRIASLVTETAIDSGIGWVNSEEIDKLGIVRATKCAMLRALDNLEIKPDYLLIDALPLPESKLPFNAIISGDAKCRSISAASIVAKVARDRYMVNTEDMYPGYGFAQHKGYPSQYHLQRLTALGPCPIHRRTFGPVRTIAEQKQNING